MKIIELTFQDMNTIDEQLPNSMQFFLDVIGAVLISLITIAIMIPIMIALFIPLALLYIVVQVC